MKDRSGPRERAWEVDGHGATFARSDTPSDYSDNHKTIPFECPPGRVDSKSKTRQSRCPDSGAQDVETCPHDDCGSPPRREKPCGTQPHATHDPARMPAERPTTETSPPRGKRHFG